MIDYLDCTFDAQAVKDLCVEWIRNYFEKNGPDAKAVVGISGGKDSSTVAALCCEALGADRVFGVLMPSNGQDDIWASEMLVKHLGIKAARIDVGGAVTAMTAASSQAGVEVSREASFNIPARMRMLTLYMVSQSIGGRVACTSNLSEDYVGYFTRWGDGVGDFAPLADMTVGEVKAVGRALGLPETLVEKEPIDGLCGLADEENLGFSYFQLDCYIRQGSSGDSEIDELIDMKHSASKFKMEPFPVFKWH